MCQTHMNASPMTMMRLIMPDTLKVPVPSPKHHVQKQHTKEGKTRSRLDRQRKRVEPNATRLHEQEL